MREKILGWAHVAFVVSISLLALIGVLLFAWNVEEATPWADMKAADWGVWVGAVGTVATLMGTVYLATAETRRRTRQESLMAELHGTSLNSRLAHAQGRLAAAKTLLENALEKEHLRAELLPHCYAHIAAIEHFSPDELLPLTFFNDNTAAKVARSTAGLKILRHISEMYSSLTLLSIEKMETLLKIVQETEPTLEEANSALKASLNRTRIST